MRLFGPVFASIFLAAIAAPSFAETRSYDFKGFKNIEASKGFDIQFTQSPTWSVKVDSRYNNLDQIVVEKVGDTLRISRPEGFCAVVTPDSPRPDKRYDNCIRHDLDDVVTISAPDLDALKLNAGVKFAAGALKANTFDIDAHAGVTIDIANLTAGAVNVRAGAAAKVNLKGSCTKLDLALGAATTINADELKCREANVDAGTASSVRAYASDRAVAKASVASKVLISGKPKDFEEQESRFSSSVSLAD